MLTKPKDLRTGNPLWLSKPKPRIPTSQLTRDQRADIVIIGAGITGAMAAESLSAAGFKVILIDRRGPLKGATSASTALLQYEIDTPLTVLSGQIGRDKAMRAWRRSSWRWRAFMRASRRWGSSAMSSRYVHCFWPEMCWMRRGLRTRPKAETK